MILDFECSVVIGIQVDRFMIKPFGEHVCSRSVSQLFFIILVFTYKTPAITQRLISGRRVGILNTEYGWPTAEEMKLDESQLKAVKSALTSELSVIQGPPGTGKTYIGLVVMKLLLANRLVFAMITY